MKNTFQLTPCGPAEPCDVDCESDDDITDKDLMVHLNQENAGVELVNEKNKSLDASKEKNEGKEGQEGKESQNECTRKKEQSEGNTGERGKKRPCRKIIKNPFFINRLNFSTDLPPRPPLPPPQFFPLANEDSKPKVCSKKKKCKKKNKSSKTGYDDDDEFGAGGGRGGAGGEEEECEEVECDEKSCVCRFGDDFDDGGRKRCKKSKGNKFYGPCRKKPSETSIPPQPRRIPALLKDLPLNCPRDIPEVERQIRMSEDHGLQRNGCKKKCKKKEKVQQLLNS